MIKVWAPCFLKARCHVDPVHFFSGLTLSWQLLCRKVSPFQNELGAAASQSVGHARRSPGNKGPEVFQPTPHIQECDRQNDLNPRPCIARSDIIVQPGLKLENSILQNTEITPNSPWGMPRWVKGWQFGASQKI